MRVVGEDSPSDSGSNAFSARADLVADGFDRL